MQDFVLDSLRPVWATINISNFLHNLALLRTFAPHSALLVVLKANAYGHGANALASVALQAGAEMLGVATLQEALEIRAHFPSAPILILGYTQPALLALAAEHDIRVCVATHEVAQALLQAHRAPKLHVKIDTGMHRIGFECNEESLELIAKMARANIDIEGVFTHFARADEENLAPTDKQHALFVAFLDSLKARGIAPRYVHCANSAAIFAKQYAHSMVRAGIAAYGIAPCALAHGLLPVMSLNARIVRIHDVPKGEGVSYGATFVARDNHCRVATLPFGYADGYMRLLSNRASMLVGNERAPVVGNVCMDQCMIDVSHIATAHVGQDVLVFGQNDMGALPVSELSELIGTIPYEIVCAISTRVPRIYAHEGRFYTESQWCAQPNPRKESV